MVKVADDPVLHTLLQRPGYLVLNHVDMTRCPQIRNTAEYANRTESKLLPGSADPRRWSELSIECRKMSGQRL